MALSFFGTCTLLGSYMLVSMAGLYDLRHLAVVSLAVALFCIVVPYGFRCLQWRWFGVAASVVPIALLTFLWGVAEFECMWASVQPPMRMPDGTLRDHDGHIRYFARSIGGLLPILISAFVSVIVAWWLPRPGDRAGRSLGKR